MRRKNAEIAVLRGDALSSAAEYNKAKLDAWR